MSQPKPYIYLGTTAAKEGMTEEAFKYLAGRIKEQLEWWNEFVKTHELVWKSNAGTWEKKNVMA